jgi:hypothetical protein
MGVRLNLFCNKQIAQSDQYKRNFEAMKWGPDHIERDGLGIPTRKGAKGTRGKKNADLSK